MLCENIRLGNRRAVLGVVPFPRNRNNRREKIANRFERSWGELAAARASL